MFRELIIQSKEVANTTSPAGFAEIQQNMSNLQQRKNLILHAEEKFGEESTHEENETSEEFDFSCWLQEKENLLMFKEVQPQTTLEEKSRLLKALKQEIVELANSADALRALEGHPDNQEVMRYKNLIHESKLIIKLHEEVISSQVKIGTILVDLRKLLDDIEKFLDLISNNGMDNKDRLQESTSKMHNVDFGKINNDLDTLKKLSVVIIPVAAENEQQIITTDISTIEDRIGVVHCSFETQKVEIEEKMKKITEYEEQFIKFMNWMDDINKQLDKYKLKAGVQIKMENVKKLKATQSEVAAKELELSDIEQSAEELEIQTEVEKLTHTKTVYSESCETIRSLTIKLQNEIESHDAIINKVKEMQSFISDQKGKLELTLKVSATNHSDMQTKREAIDTLIKSKEEGNGRVIQIVKMQEAFLPTIPQEDQVAMKSKVKCLHNEWHEFISLLTERRLVFDNQINDWKEITEQSIKITNQLDEIDKMLQDVNTSNTSLSKVREQVDMLRHIKEKLKCSKLDIDAIQRNVVEGCTTGKNHPDWPLILTRYDSLIALSQDELNIRENTLHNYREYKNHISDLEQFLQRCKDKVQTVEQRSPNDKNYANAIIQALSNLLNKEAQGQIMIEHVEQASAVLISKTPSYEVEINKRTNELKVEFTRLFEEVSRQNKRLNVIMKYFSEFKDETERLTDWTKQININIKAIKTSLPSTLSDKKKSLDDMKELCTRLEQGKDQTQKYVNLADKMNDSPLESNVVTQKKEIVSKFQLAQNTAIEVLERVETMYDYHQEFQLQVETARKWMERAWEKIRQNSSSAGKSREDLQYQLSEIQNEIDNQNQGLSYVQAAMDNAEKAMKNTRSDGKDAIQQSIKELNADWEKLTRKMATAKVGVETDLLQWSDEQQSVSRLEEWIKDRETRLHAAVQHKNVMITRRSTLGITTLSVSERSKSLGQANMILQDIQAFEPLVQTFTSSVGNSQDSPLMDIAKKYRDLSKHAQEVLDHEKEMVKKHEYFMTAGNDFMQWLKTAKEKLEKCSERVDEKDFLSEKLTHLKILEAEVDEGKGKLDYALQMAIDACSLALDDDR
jgi:nesprin-1